MRDSYGRTIDYLRISLTDKCNLQCIYCRPDDTERLLHSDRVLSFEEIIRIIGISAELGIRKIKVTGGEPLMRKDCVPLIREMKKIPGIEQVTITTNGVYLKDNIEELAAAGIDGINISLDTMDQKEYLAITKKDCYCDAMEGIKKAIEYGKIPVKINCVPIVRDDKTLLKIALLAKDHPIHVRFIERMPIGCGKEVPFRSEKEIKTILESRYGTLTHVSRRLGNGPAVYYTAAGFQGTIGFISAMTHQFCQECNRLRVTCDGVMKPCLQFQGNVSLRDLMRQGCSDRQLKDAMKKVILEKPKCHHFEGENTEEVEKRMMSQIGG